MSKKVLLKDLLFNTAKVKKISQEIEHAYPTFKGNEFANDVLAKFPKLELKERISWITECLRKHLPDDYNRSVNILLKALPPPNNPHLSDDDFGDFIYAPYADFVAKNGCGKENLQLSLNALYEITQRFSAEDAIRYFLNAFPKETLETLLEWSKDSHYHVRRLCSEGTRPKLPWSQKIRISYTAPITILDNLFYDSKRYVTRSVANHLNDISKIDANLALDKLEEWRASKKQEPHEMGYIVHHALRTLAKQGNARALRMLGFSHAAKVNVSKFVMPAEVKMNTPLEFSFSVRSSDSADVLIDYIIHFQTKVGKLNGKKVFKLAKLSLVKNNPITISKRHLFKQQMTTRTLYPGKHLISIQVNGRVLETKEFEIV